MYLWPCTGCTSLVQGIYQGYYPKDWIKSMQVGSLSLIQSKKMGTYNFIVYVDDALEIVDITDLLDTLEYIRK